MEVVLLGRFKFKVNLFRCETCGFKMVGDKDQALHLGHRWRPLYHFHTTWEQITALWWIVKGRI
jgi:hypothetical protein